MVIILYYIIGEAAPQYLYKYIVAERGSGAAVQAAEPPRRHAPLALDGEQRLRRHGRPHGAF